MSLDFTDIISVMIIIYIYSAGRNLQHNGVRVLDITRRFDGYGGAPGFAMVSAAFSADMLPRSTFMSAAGGNAAQPCIIVSLHHEWLIAVRYGWNF
jgi:hypothetical protein